MLLDHYHSLLIRPRQVRRFSAFLVVELFHMTSSSRPSSPQNPHVEATLSSWTASGIVVALMGV